MWRLLRVGRLSRAGCGGPGPKGRGAGGIPMDPSLEGEQWICDGRDERGTARSRRVCVAAKPPGSAARKRYARGAGLAGRRAGIDTRW